MAPGFHFQLAENCGVTAMTFLQKTIVLMGASTGIRRSFALALADQGANLVLASRHQTALEDAVHACTETGGTAIASPTDVTQPEACEQLGETALAEFGQIDIPSEQCGNFDADRF